MPGRRLARKAGLPPGTIVYVGEEGRAPAAISLMSYTDDCLDERESATVEECRDLMKEGGVTWINVSGVHDVDLVEKVGHLLNLHPILLEDVAHTGQRTKMDEYEGHLFFALHMIYFQDGDLIDEQVSLVVGKNVVLSFLENPGDVFDPIRERIRQAKGRIRSRGADFLAYTLMDTLVDNYFLVVETMAERMEALESEVLENPRVQVLNEIQRQKRQVILLRRAVWPLRDVVARLERAEGDLFGPDMRVYVKDLHDHSVQVMETVETFRDVMGGVLDIYLSQVSNRMNQVMKVLTVIATIFIPLTFLVGVYGMNFEFMPELAWRWGYPALWGFMVTLAVVMLVLFKRKNWL